MQKISIIIRCLNEEKHIEKLLEGVLQQSYKNYEIIVVDSGSTDETLVRAKKYSVKIIEIKPEEFSFGYALNVGCEAATGDLLLFASAHVYPVYDDWLEKIVAHFENKKVGLVYGRQIGNETTKFSEHRIFAKWFPPVSDYNQEHPFCNNANTAIRKSIWEKLPYDEALTGLEDMDWAKKMLLQGHKIIYDATATIVHVHEETPKRILNRYRREAIAHKRIFTSQEFSFWDFLKLTTTNIISDYYHAFHEKKLLKNIVDIPVFRVMQFYGTYKGYQQYGPVTWQLKRRFYYPNKLKRSEDKGLEKGRTINYSTKEKQTSL